MGKLFIIAVVALGACGKNKIDQAISDAEDFKARMCDCADNDRACADKINAEFRSWRKSLKETISKDDEKGLPKEQKQRFSAALEGMEKCGLRARGDDNTQRIAQMLAKIGELKDKMCACKDKPCVDATQKEMGLWTASQMQDAGKLKLSESDQKKMAEIGTQISACGAAASGAK